MDYSSHYKNFYDIFVGQILDPKNFDISFVARETRNMFASFVNIMDANAITMKRKHVFEQAPMEKSISEYYKQMVIPNAFALVGKNINDLELEMQNKGNDMMMQVLSQVELREKYNLLKNKNESDIIKEANEKTSGN